ncbi:MAG TPA: helix-turn-helix transcriptional regulator [Bacteroidia bacterium]|nr:helix-turn-helix transcriptional regulator [Bacteroidia bacterium]
MPVKKKKKEPVRLNRLKEILAKKNINQTELAEMLDRERNSISRICNNISQPSLRFLYEIARVLDIDARELLVPREELKD